MQLYNVRVIEEIVNRALSPGLMDQVLVAKLGLQNCLSNDLLVRLVVLDDVDDRGGKRIVVDGLYVLIAITDYIVLRVILQFNWLITLVRLNLLDIVNGETGRINKFELIEFLDLLVGKEGNSRIRQVTGGVGLVQQGYLLCLRNLLQLLDFAGL